MAPPPGAQFIHLFVADLVSAEIDVPRAAVAMDVGADEKISVIGQLAQGIFEILVTTPAKSQAKARSMPSSSA